MNRGTEWTDRDQEFWPASGFLAQYSFVPGTWGPHPSVWQEVTSSTPPPTEATTEGVSGISSEETSRGMIGINSWIHGVSTISTLSKKKGLNVEYLEISGLKMINQNWSSVEPFRYIQNMHASLLAAGLHIEWGSVEPWRDRWLPPARGWTREASSPGTGSLTDCSAQEKWFIQLIRSCYVSSLICGWVCFCTCSRRCTSLW